MELKALIALRLPSFNETADEAMANAYFVELAYELENCLKVSEKETNNQIGIWENYTVLQQFFFADLVAIKLLYFKAAQLTQNQGTSPIRSVKKADVDVIGVEWETAKIGDAPNVLHLKDLIKQLKTQAYQKAQQLGCNVTWLDVPQVYETNNFLIVRSDC